MSGTTLGDRTLLLLARAVFVMTDVPLQRLQHTQRLKMGCHEIKANMRARMREMTMRRMTTRVPAADLVGIDPTHCAVALKYDDKKESNAPARPVTVLARSLYAHAELDREGPAALLAAVAQVFAYVCQLRAAFAGQIAMPADLAGLNVPAALDAHKGPVSGKEAFD